MIWCRIGLHRWSRWCDISRMSGLRVIRGGLPVWKVFPVAVQEKTCRICGKTKQRKV